MSRNPSLVKPILATIAIIANLAAACTPRNQLSDDGPSSGRERKEISNVSADSSETTEISNLGSSETININKASAEELQRLPYVGESMAQKIIEHREKYGPFKRPEHLMLIHGMSDVRFRRIRHLVRVE